jgi:putative ABC transport system permease protein
MIRNLFVSAFRNLVKQKFFSILNIFGLAIGMAVFLFIVQYVSFETSYENFLPGAANIYRVTLEQYLNNEKVVESAENYPAVGPALVAELPEISGYARLYNLGYKNNVIITNHEARPDPIAVKTRSFLYADSSFLSMLGYEMKSGDVATVLSQPLTAVVSESYARIFFGNDNPIGRMLQMNDDDYNDELVKVTGVFKDIPDNTHMKFDILFSYETLYGRGDWAKGRYDESWQRKDMYTFVSIQPGTDMELLESKFPSVVKKYNPQLKEQGRDIVLRLQPLKNIHLHSNLAEEFKPNGDARIVKFLGIIAIFVMVIAWINYINMATAQAMERAREVGVRKVMGAVKIQLIQQFFVEAAAVNVVSVFTAFVLTVVLLPYFNSISGLSLTGHHLLEPWFLGVTLGLWLTGTFLSGFYPAMVLSSFKPVTVLKGKLRKSAGGVVLRKSLVIVQFVASIALIAATLIIHRQLSFMMNQDLGLNIDQVLVVERPGILPRDRKAFDASIDVFRNELAKEENIESVTTSATVPGKQRQYKAGIKRYGTSDDQMEVVRFNSMDYNFIDVFKMKLITGRLFSRDYVQDQDTSAIITASAVRLLGFAKPEDAIGQTVVIPQFEWSAIVVGVVNDYHQVSLKEAMEPTLFYCSPNYGEFYSMRINSRDITKTIAHVRQSWEKAFPGNPFEYFFLDDYFNQQYSNERKFGWLFSSFSVLAVLVGCLGLFGLSAYTVHQRTKEIGIRKVLGSSEGAIFVLLSKDYLILILISIVIATPVVWHFMRDWINSFSYHITITPVVFVAAGLTVMLVALLTVSFQTVKASRTNPVDTLRHE